MIPGAQGVFHCGGIKGCSGARRYSKVSTSRPSHASAWRRAPGNSPDCRWCSRRRGSINWRRRLWGTAAHQAAFAFRELPGRPPSARQDGNDILHSALAFQFLGIHRSQGCRRTALSGPAAPGRATFRCLLLCSALALPGTAQAASAFSLSMETSLSAAVYTVWKISIA